MDHTGSKRMDYVAIGRQAISRFGRNDMTTHAAALSYATLFAIFPFLLFLIALLGTLNIPEFFDWLLEQAESAMPADAYRLFADSIDQIRGQAQGGILSFGIIAALWGASAGVRSLMNSLNVAFAAKESRPAWKRYVFSVVYTLGFVALFVASAALMLLGPDLMERLASGVGLSSAFVTAWNWLRFPVLALLLGTTISLIYYFLPNLPQRLPWITPGAIVAVIGWILASAGFSFYVSNFASYSATYGSLGGVIVLLMYFYISSLILLLGAEITAEFRRWEQHREPPTQIPAQPDSD